MLNVVGPLSVVRVPDTMLERHYQLGTLGHGHVVELQAYLRGEPVSSFGLPSLWTVPVSETTLTCSDGVLVVPYRKETLCRHFTLFSNYWSDYPDEVSVPLPTLTVRDMEDVLDTVMHGRDTVPLARVLYTLQTLDPINPLCYCLFAMHSVSPSFIAEVMEGVTPQQRESVLNRHTVVRETYLPNYGAGLCVLAATDWGRDYLLTKEGSTLLPQHRSWLFTAARELNLENDMLEFCSHLIRLGFNEPEFGPCNPTDILGLLLLCAEYDGALLPQVCMMIGVHHPKLNGELVDPVYAPYQLDLRGEPFGDFEFETLQDLLDPVLGLSYEELEQVIFPS